RISCWYRTSMAFPTTLKVVTANSSRCLRASYGSAADPCRLVDARRRCASTGSRFAGPDLRPCSVSVGSGSRCWIYGRHGGRTVREPRRDENDLRRWDPRDGVEQPEERLHARRDTL